MLIPHKVKNKGKYISFHYLRGWKARKIRKVQEISPQIPICRHLHYTSSPIEKIAYFMKLVGWEQLATQGVPRWQVHKREAGGSQRRGAKRPVDVCPAPTEAERRRRSDSCMICSRP
ncbi:hypothetical protein DWY37_14055 [Roseburia sp. AF25-13LB]|nr:hypothetical protein DWY49_12970 [Roseburia sp. AF25-25LB]RHQ40337.1 hypothetical protein DWY43_12900 [Roseburia sp. AF25-18LB]RHQ45930.1 hypothetical protein DWY39_14070 [Roseburia sp. AF25-15LB]RHQ46189.1 hypothetical protein DWY37_14055 [Roseburia sp. AF25-13LB]